MKPRYPWSLERRYERALLRYVAHVHEASQLEVAGLRALHVDGFWSDVKDAFKALKERFTGGPAPAAVREHGEGIAAWTVRHSPTIAMPPAPRPLVRSAVAPVLETKILEDLAVEYGIAIPRPKPLLIAVEPRADVTRATRATVDAWTRENIRLITSINAKYFDELSVLLDEAAAKGWPSDRLAKLIADRYGVLMSNARRIARDQTGKLHGEIAKERQIAAGYTTYVWQTQEDDRVRDTHVHLNGKIMRWDTPHPTEGYPGQAIMCRCIAVQHGRE